ncbi:MAG TPA: ABC transporter permease [Phycisphaerae bacterium]|nr:ABC transporter permease [Phycisphaerae bacterium]
MADRLEEPAHARPHGPRPEPGLLRRAWRRANRYTLAVVTVGFLLLFVGAVMSVILADLTSRFFQWDILFGLFRQPHVLAAMKLSGFTSGVTLALVVLFCVPIGYALSRYRFPGHAVVDTIIDLPIVMPPLAIGVSLLVLFASEPGKWLGDRMDGIGWDRNAAAGIILCQFLLSVPFAIRAAKSAFDGVDGELEGLAMTLGCTRWRAFWRVALPMARGGLLAGCVMAWARAVGLYGPLMVFVGCVRGKSEVLPNTIYLEVSTGGIEVALAVTMVMIALAGVALVAIHGLAGGRRWWGA